MTEMLDPREQRRQERHRRREERRQRWTNRQNHEFGVIHSRHSRIWTGIFILLIGLAWLLKASIPFFPEWVFSWQMLLVALAAGALAATLALLAVAALIVRVPAGAEAST